MYFKSSVTAHEFRKVCFHRPVLMPGKTSDLKEGAETILENGACPSQVEGRGHER